MKGKYSADAVSRISAGRTQSATDIVAECGGSLTAVYATLGEDDLLVIVEFPGVEEAVKASVALNRAFGISFATTPALSIERFDALVGS
jgi:uncharacterized protein with GYD domain